MKKPPHNDSPEAIRLRGAAKNFSQLGEVADQHDTAGQRANRELLTAARAYGALGRPQVPSQQALTYASAVLVADAQSMEGDSALVGHERESLLAIAAFLDALKGQA